jgi:hypothetical protein
MKKEKTKEKYHFHYAHRPDARSQTFLRTTMELNPINEAHAMRWQKTIAHRTTKPMRWQKAIAHRMTG